MQADEVDNVAACLAPEARKALPVKVDKETRTAIGMEWTQTLPAMGAGSLELHSSPLHNLDQPISELDVANIAVPMWLRRLSRAERPRRRAQSQRQAQPDGPAADRREGCQRRLP